MDAKKAATADPESPETPVVLASVPAAEALIDGPLSELASAAAARNAEPRFAVHI